MERVLLKPGKARLTALMLGLAVLTLVMAFLPAVCLPVALVMPLLACPLFGQERGTWIACLSAVAPCACSMLNGYDALYSLSLASVGVLTLAATARVNAKRMPVRAAIAQFVFAYAAALLMALLAASRALGGNISTGLADAAETWVLSGDQPGLTLYRLATYGLVGVPDSYQNASLMAFVFDSSLIRQMTLSLRLTVTQYARAFLPSLFMQAVLIGGLFCALRVTRINGSLLVVKQLGLKTSDRVTLVEEPPGFGALDLAGRERWTLMFMGLAGLMLLSGGSLAQTLGLLFYAAFQTVYQLLGAAALVGALTMRRPEHKALIGVGAAIVYAVAPVALLMAGIMDSFLHIRTRRKPNEEEHKEE